MSISLFSTSLQHTLTRQIPRTVPVLISRVNGAVSFKNSGNPYTQKRTFFIDFVVNTSINAVVLTTACAGLRRISGLDMRMFVDKMEDSRWKYYIFRYLDFGERCADKILQILFLKKKNSLPQNTYRQQDYTDCNRYNDYDRYRSNQRNNHYNDRDYH